MKKLLVIGAGGHGKAVAEAARLSNAYEVVGFLDDSYVKGMSAFGLPVLGELSDIQKLRIMFDEFFVAIGANSVRQSIQNRLINDDHVCASIFHPSAIISPSAKIGVGVAVMAGAIIGTESRLHDGVLVNCGSVVDHHCELACFAHLGVGVTLAGGTFVGEGAWLQAGSALGYGIRVPANFCLGPNETLRNN